MKALRILIIAGLAWLVSPNLVSAQGCAPPKSDEGVSVFGFIQPQFETKFTGDGTRNAFTFNRARIGVTGLIPYDFLYYAVIETSAFKDSNPFLLDAFISYQRFSFAKISIGQFKSPFTLEMSTPCSELNTIYRTSTVNDLVSPDRDLGVMVSGSFKDNLLSYSLALTNGTGKGVFDNNLGKTIHSRVVLKPLSFVKIGGGVQYGTHPPFVDTIPDEDQRFRWAFDLQLKHKNFDIIGEYVYGNDKGSYVVGGGCGGTPEIKSGDLRRSGYYITAMYKTPWNIQPVFRYENWNTNLNEENAYEQIMVFGLNYWFNDWTRMQVNYLYKAEKKFEVKNDELVVQFQIVF
ncbi:MAG: porin [Bacteroidales bacterium]|nr:porin [Bacteroidales bacterium]MDZ4204983.1 porin [Bacteroidales bacterium]